MCKKRTLSTDWYSNAIRWNIFINLCCSYFYLYAIYLAKPSFIPDAIFAFANVSWIINVIVRNIFIFFNPRIVCFSNLKSLSILPFILSILVLFLYSFFHLSELRANFVNIRGSVFNGILNILLSLYFGWKPYLWLFLLLSYPLYINFISSPLSVI